MQNFIKDQFASLSAMSKKERLILLIKLLVKQNKNTIELDEIIQLEIIQTIRRANGEIDAVLKSWEENPDLDPRKN